MKQAVGRVTCVDLKIVEGDNGWKEATVLRASGLSEQSSEADGGVSE